MTQYDAGPGDWSDREWEAPDWKSKAHAKRRKLVLPPWALLAIVIGIVILLCAGLVFAVQAIRGGGARKTPTPTLTATAQIAPTATVELPVPTALLPQPTATEREAPAAETGETPPAFTEIAPGATVVVRGTAGQGLRLRAQPSTQSRVLAGVQDGTELTVLAGPEEQGGYVWWQLRTPDGKEGWGAANWLVLQTEQ